MAAQPSVRSHGRPSYWIRCSFTRPKRRHRKIRLTTGDHLAGVSGKSPVFDEHHARVQSQIIVERHDSENRKRGKRRNQPFAQQRKR